MGELDYHRERRRNEENGGVGDFRLRSLQPRGLAETLWFLTVYGSRDYAASKIIINGCFLKWSVCNYMIIRIKPIDMDQDKSFLYNWVSWVNSLNLQPY
ncbi:hypothetical protein YC2023_077504 [Brassica napus]